MCVANARIFIYQTPVVSAASYAAISVTTYQYSYEFMDVRTTVMLHKEVEPDRTLYV